MSLFYKFGNFTESHPYQIADNIVFIRSGHSYEIFLFNLNLSVVFPDIFLSNPIKYLYRLSHNI